ncbi:WxcM-like domain-containing protein [Flavobacterium sp. CHNK8]|uniref:polysaccharide biosynthesis C-terminal domain-containing protein n=1 Tax=Flavobacterium sp. CHNK8 TaxID=2871165 RepID=UPI001C8E0386|nr:WxcM-like domain-containing protein [Flavobacterium sp. CHNK8]QZK89589.1 WxcM-like domain-containing protein [Flavobacterium sp. CHNK8]
MSLSKKIFTYKRNKIEDSRGWFLKVLTGTELNLPNRTGEVYLTMAKPGEIKGGHYHPKANEWFTLITGECILRLEDMENQEFMEIFLNADDPVTVYVPFGIAHAFYNTSKEEEFILMAYSDQLFDPADTIPFNFKNLSR